MSKRILMLAGAILAISAGAASAQVTKTDPLDAEPVLRPPAVDYRKEWVQLGTFSVLADKPQDGAKQLHQVYTARENLEAYLKNGRFPDGAVIVKDVWSTRTEALTTGTASFASSLSARFVMVKDDQGKLGQGPRFGDGWGWAYFVGDEKVKTITGDYKVDCLTCHEPARSNDLLFLEGYPILRK